MRTLFILMLSCVYLSNTFAQNVGINTTTPVAKLDLRGTYSNPSIPGAISTGAFRIGVSPNEAIDFGKMQGSPFSAWLQVGYQGTTTDPLALQPLGGNVGIGTTNPATSAVLDVSSTTKGFLPPRMTLSERNSITSPVEGLMIWCHNCGFYGQTQVYNGSFWIDMTGKPALGAIAVGMQDGGGIVAYLFQTGDPGYVAGEVHGLIAAPTDLAVEIKWGCETVGIPGADAVAIGAGNQNTIDITNTCTYPGIAANFCSDMIIGGYSDWYMPSKNELNRLFTNRELIGGFMHDYYWSSSEINNDLAWAQTFYFGGQVQIEKQYALGVRPIRSF